MLKIAIIRAKLVPEAEGFPNSMIEGDIKEDIEKLRIAWITKVEKVKVVEA